MKQPNKSKQTLKEYLKVFFDKAHTVTVNLFFRLLANEYSAEGRLIREEVRSDFGELIGKGITFKNVDSYGGEDQGEDYCSVYEFTLDNEVCWIKFDGWYSSYTGREYTEFFFVEPKEVVVTKYFKA